MADQKDIFERVSELPDDLRKALFARSTTDTIQVVGKNAGLSIDKIGELADETGRVMLGITSPSDYVKNLVSRLSVNQEKAKAIAEEINQKVFQPVRESLKKIHGIAEEVKKPEAPPQPKPVIPTQPKPLPKREDIVVPSIPPIFVKKMPPPVGGADLPPKPDILPVPKEPLPQDSLAAKSALDKELSAPPSPRPQQYKEKDPYREIIE